MVRRKGISGSLNINYKVKFSSRTDPTVELKIKITLMTVNELKRISQITNLNNLLICW